MTKRKGRLISFALTTAQVVDMTKTVTRRNGWGFVKAGDVLQPVNRVRGFKKGEHPQPLLPGWHIVVVDARWEALEAITLEDVALEGFPRWTPEQFIEFYCQHNGGNRKQQVRRIEFRYERDEEMSTTKMRDDLNQRPTTITAAQWDTIAGDVKAGRVKAYLSGSNVITARKEGDHLRVWLDGEGSVTWLLSGGNILTLEWLDQPKSESAPEVESIDDLVSLEASGLDSETYRKVIGDIEPCSASPLEVKRLKSENKRLQAELDAAKHELEARRSILEMAVTLKMELLPERAGNGWIDSIQQLGQMARDERERADAYLNHLAVIRDAALKPQDALASDWLAAVVSEPSSVVGLVKARMGQIEKLREALVDIQATARTSLDSGAWGTHEMWLEHMKAECEHLATMALRELDKTE